MTKEVYTFTILQEKGSIESVKSERIDPMQNGGCITVKENRFDSGFRIGNGRNVREHPQKYEPKGKYQDIMIWLKKRINKYKMAMCNF